MSDQQYYTPATQDLFKGYECEYLISKNADTGHERWDRFWFGVQGLGNMEALLRNEMIRTTFITREQIEAEGWVIGWYEAVSYMDSSQDTLHMRGHNARGVCIYGCIYNRLSRHILISIQQGRGVAQTIFAGHCPSINEFRKICKMIGIVKKEAVAG